jgi:transposase InsO family protein
MKAELETGLKVKALHSDGGGEYTAKHVQQYLEDRGITHKMMMADTPQHNGVAEWLNRTLLDKTRAMLSDANLPESYWLEALNYAVLLHNVSPSKFLGTTPTEEYTGTKPDISRLRVFGCVAHVYVPAHARGKLSARSMACTFLGFAQ